MSAVPTITSFAQRPRLLVLANGVIVKGAVKAEVHSNGYLQADRFNVTVATGLDPSLPLAWWAAQNSLTIEVLVGLLPLGAPEGTAFYQSLLKGNVDAIDLDPFSNTVGLTGRDLSSGLIDTKTTETFANQTSSQVATTLAARHGLTPSVQATTTIVGQYYSQEHDTITLGNFSRVTTEWDLLTYLAQQEGFDVWVQSNTLYFQPLPSGSTPFQITYTPGVPGVSSPVSNVLSLKMERSLTLAQDIQVTVKAWRPSDGKAYTRVVKSAGTNRAGLGKPQNYSMTAANKTPAEALKIAQQAAARLSQHERILSVTMPGELTLSTRSQVALSGTATSFDQTYYVAELEREISFDSGFTQTLRLKNSSPRTQTTVQ